MSNSLRTSCVFICLLLLAQTTAAQEAPGPKGPLSPGEALKNFHLADGLTIELVAAEPEVVDPVAIRFDDYGRMWVVEMRDYPNGPKPGEPPLSKIKILQDQDHDGTYDGAVTFAENLLFPTGIQPWKDGVIVTFSGRVAYFGDENGDGTADRIIELFSGFTEENPQLRANHPTLAIDNYIYIANGLRGGEVQSVDNPNAPRISISGRDFRFDPLTQHYEAISGVGQFGLTFDDFGRRFVCSNRNPLRHIVLEDRYLKLNPAVTVPDVVHDVAAAEDKSRLFPISRAWTTSNLHANQFTAACGVLIYRGDALSSRFYGNAFTCDPTGNLVHREILERAGPTFVSQPAEQEKEFLATADEWFRPVNLEVGPDGALYVVDMYRAVIEHPQFVPDELKHRPDERFGDDRGRIYRIREKEASARNSLLDHRFPLIHERSAVQELNSTNSWRRETAARLILESQDRDYVPPLRNTATSAESPLARAHAVWLLQGLGALTVSDLEAALKDSHLGVREQALVLAEPHLANNQALRKQVLNFPDDPKSDARICFQTMLSLAPVQSDDEAFAVAATAFRFASDPWMRRAAMLASGEYAPSVARQILSLTDLVALRPEVSVPLCREFFYAAGAVERNWNEPLLLKVLNAPGDRNQAAWAALAGLLSAWDAHRVPWRDEVQKSTDVQKLLREFYSKVTPLLLDASEPTAVRRELVELVRFDSSNTALRELALRDSDSQELRIMAIRASAGIADREFWNDLLARFPGESPAVRTAIVNAALDGTDSAAWLLDELQSGHMKAQELGRTEVERLSRLPTAELQQRAAKILESLTPEDRQKALARYTESLKLDADAFRGREVFSKNCANCHHVGGIGVDVAPDISDSRTKSFEQLLGDVIQPNRAIDGNYINYVVQTSEGQIVTGIISAETATSLTLRQPEDKSITLSRREIDSIQSTGLSLMPEGLEQNLSLQDMADLLSFIKNWRYLDGQIPIEPAR